MNSQTIKTQMTELEKETCAHCGNEMSGKQAIEVSEWLLEETATYTLDQGPICSFCARKYRATHK